MDFNYKNSSNKSAASKFYTSSGISRYPLDEKMKEFKVTKKAQKLIDTFNISIEGMRCECGKLSAIMSESAGMNEVDKEIGNSLKYIRRSLIVFKNEAIPILLDNNIFHIVISLLFHQNIFINKNASYTLYVMTSYAPNCIPTLFSLNLIQAIYQTFGNFMQFVDFVMKNKIVESRSGSMIEDENLVLDVGAKVFTIVRLMFIYLYIYEEFESKSPEAFAPFTVKCFNDIFESSSCILSKSHFSPNSVYRDSVLQQRQQNYISNTLNSISLIYREMCKKPVSPDDLAIIIEFLFFIISSNFTDIYAYVMEILINLVESGQIASGYFRDPDNNTNDLSNDYSFFKFMNDEILGADAQSKCRAMDLFVYLLNQGMPFDIHQPDAFIDLILSTIDINAKSKAKKHNKSENEGENEFEILCEASAAGLRLIATIIRNSDHSGPGEGWIVRYLTHGNGNSSFGFMTLIEMCSGQQFCIGYAAAHCLIELLSRIGTSGVAEINSVIYTHRENDFFTDPGKRNRTLIKALLSCAQLQDDGIAAAALGMLISMIQAAHATGFYEELKCDYFMHDGFDCLEEIKEQHQNDEIAHLANIAEKEFSPTTSE